MDDYTPQECSSILAELKHLRQVELTRQADKKIAPTHVDVSANWANSLLLHVDLVLDDLEDHPNDFGICKRISAIKEDIEALVDAKS